MSGPEGLSADLHRYLQQGRDALLRAVDGVSEYDARRRAAGTNLLGLVKHVAGSTATSSRRSVRGAGAPWNEDGSVWEGADMWPSSESREYLVDLYCSVWAVPDAAIADLPLDAPASVAWWPEERRVTTFGHLLVRVVAETAQHAGHAGILREGLDGQGGPPQGRPGGRGEWSRT